MVTKKAATKIAGYSNAGAVTGRLQTTGPNISSPPTNPGEFSQATARVKRATPKAAAKPPVPVIDPNTPYDHGGRNADGSYTVSFKLNPNLGASKSNTISVRAVPLLKGLWDVRAIDGERSFGKLQLSAGRKPAFRIIRKGVKDAMRSLLLNDVWVDTIGDKRANRAERVRQRNAELAATKARPYIPPTPASEPAIPAPAK